MAHLYQVVNLNPAGNLGIPHTGSVNAGIRLHFHLVSEEHRPTLGDFMPSAALLLGKSKAVRADHGPVLQNHAVSQRVRG
jgi:hypothetical protein